MKVARIMGLTSAAQVAVGITAFYILASHPGLAKYKIFNAFGLMLNIGSVLLLSKIVVDAAGKHSVAFDYLYATIWAGLHNLPMGMIIGSILLSWLHLPSSGIVVAFAVGILAYLAIPLFIFDYAGEIFKWGFYASVAKRIVFMGWYLLLAGMGLQLVGSLLDLSG